MSIPPDLAAVLPVDTADAWTVLASVIPDGATLYGGTGLAAHLHHRVSRDLDFYLSQPADLDELASRLEQIRPLAIQTLQVDTLNGLFGRTKVQFLLATDQDVVAPVVEIAGMPVASLPDLMATKLKVLRDRPELRDYFDLMCIEQRAPYGVVEGLGFYRARFGAGAERTMPEVVRALGYFDDVPADPGLAVGREEIVKYWQRRQPEIVAALGRR